MIARAFFAICVIAIPILAAVEAYIAAGVLMAVVFVGFLVVTYRPQPLPYRLMIALGLPYVVGSLFTIVRVPSIGIYGGGVFALAGIDTFKALNEPGYAKAVMNYRIVPDDAGGSLITTETRVYATDATARRRFTPYWRLIYPGSALLRRSFLEAIRRRAEQS